MAVIFLPAALLMRKTRPLRGWYAAGDGGSGAVIVEYLQAALERATYEIIDDEEPFYGEIVGVDGVWATGKTLESCRRNLMQALEDWVLFSLHRGATLPVLDGIALELPRKAG